MLCTKMLLRRLVLSVGCVFLMFATIGLGEPRPASVLSKVAVNTLSSLTGSPLGGTQLSITGAGFTAVRSVEFGSITAARFRVISPGVLTAVVPAHSVGHVHVRVSTSHGTSAVRPSSRFSYVEPAVPTMARQHPSVASITTVTLPTRVSKAPTAPAISARAAQTGGAASNASATSPLQLFIDQSRYYGGTNSSSMVSLSGNDLVLSTKREANGRYLSSELQSDYFTYGTVTVRARLSAGTGLWPAIWMVPQVSGKLGTPEIDLDELPQPRPGQTNIGYFTYHWTDSTGVPWAISTVLRMPFDLTTGYHAYRMTWSPGSITWWVDSIQVLHVESNPSKSTGRATRNPGTSAARTATPGVIPIFSGPMQLRINNAVGSARSWAGEPDATTPFPNTMVVQSISITSPGRQQMLAQAGNFRLSVR